MLCRIVFVLGLLLLPLTLVAEELSPVPERADQAKAFKTIQTIYKDDYAKRGDEAEEALAAKLRQQSEKLRGSPVERYVALREAARLAKEAGKVALMTDCVGEIVAGYEVDGLGLRLELLGEIERKVSRGEETADLAEAYLEVARDALQADEFKAAGTAVRAGSKYARRTNDKDLEDRAETLEDRIKHIEAAYEKAAHARTVLETLPDDPVANLTLGDYHCLVKNDWETGLPYLAKGGDPGLSDLAKRELALPRRPDAATILVLADGYYDRAQSVPDENARAGILRHAGHWYGKALSQVDGLEQVRVNQRIAEIEKFLDKVAGIETAEEIPAGAVLILTFEERTMGSKGRVIEDQSGNGMTAATRGIEFEPGVAGRGAVLNARDSLSVEGHAALRFEEAFSASLWVRTKDLDDTKRAVLIGMLDWKNDAGWMLQAVGRDGRMVTFDLMKKKRKQASKIGFPQRDLNDNAWHHLAVVYSSGKGKIYLDGRLRKSLSSGTYRVPRGAGLSIGRSFTGMVDEVAVFNRALSENEIRSLRKLGLRGKVLK